MHELGHNVGLYHSHDEVSYGDETCLMGSSPAKIDGPDMCFNSVKSWQLSWYIDTQLIINAEDISVGVYTLVSFAQYSAIAREATYTIIKIAETADKFDYFLSFVIQEGITADNKEGKNKVLVTKRAASSEYEDSYLLVRLGEDEEYIAKMLKNGKYAAIQVKSVTLSTTPKSASVRLSKYLRCKSNVHCNDYDSCTTDECTEYDRYGEGVCVHHPIECNLCGSKIDITTTTNEYPDHYSWKLENINNNVVVMSNINGQLDSSTYSESKCLAFGEYKILFSYSYTENMTDMKTNVTYSVEAEDISIFSLSSDEYFESEEFFTVCSSDEDCNDFDGCTVDICNQTTRICENKEMNRTECNNCTWVSIGIVFDNYPEETSWNLASIANNKHVSILSGE